MLDAGPCSAEELVHPRTAAFGHSPEEATAVEREPAGHAFAREAALVHPLDWRRSLEMDAGWKVACRMLVFAAAAGKDAGSRLLSR